MRLMLLTLASIGLVAALAAPADSGDKKKIVFTDPDKAGADWATQGEYIGKATTLAVEVIARGDGKFDVNFLPDGLRGKGGDFDKRISGTAVTNGTTTTVTTKDKGWSATIVNGIMNVKNPGGDEFMLKKFVRQSETLGKKPPAGAVVLYGGPDDVKNWSNGKVVDGNLLGNDSDSTQKFKDQKIHLEFRLSFMPFEKDQGRSNSGVYPQHRYEVQVLDSFGLKGESYECGGIYNQIKPKVNMCYPPLQWQTFDIELKMARFDADAKKTANAVITVYHNGVLIHDHAEVKGPTGGGHKETPEGGPLHLQGHGGQVQYRNVWVLPEEQGKQ